MEQTKDVEPKRELSAKSLAINVINLTIGAGIFVLPAIVGEKLGPASFISYIVCGILVILIMLCFAETGSKITGAGGAYAYVSAAFGPLSGFLINTLFWFGFCLLADAAVANAMVDMLQIWFPVFSINYVRVFIFIAMFGSFTLFNIRGVKRGSQLVVAVTILKLMPLILLVLIGFFYISPGNLVVKTWPGINTVGDISLVLFFAFMGPECALNLSGEIKNPQKAIPKGIFMGVAGILVMYLSIQFVYQGVMGNGLAMSKDAPLSALATKLIGPVGGTIILITSVISMFGNISGDVLASPRILYAASKDKLLPDFLSRIHPKFATPYWSLIVYGSLLVLFSMSGSFKALAVLASSSVLIIYLSVVLATIQLRFKKGVTVKGAFKIPGGLVIPMLAVCGILWFLSHITGAEIKALSVFFAINIVFYFINKKIRMKRIGIPA